mmetsp:Transcript_8885/g.25574  ORF Transcript_8885/g.25574 Transcript_8885/m.25574 type:complete len:112 (-) Transcript_8885:129-464(-)
MTPLCRRGIAFNTVNSANVSNSVFEKHEIHVYQFWLKIIILQFVFAALLELRIIGDFFIRQNFRCLAHKTAKNRTIAFVIDILHNFSPFGTLKVVPHHLAHGFDELSNVVC